MSAFILIEHKITLDSKVKKVEIEDWLVGTGICQIHNSKMSAKKILVTYGLPPVHRLPTDDYHDNWHLYRAYSRKTKSILFPNCDDPIPRTIDGCINKDDYYVKKYVCRYCNDNRDRWIKDNW